MGDRSILCSADGELHDIAHTRRGNGAGEATLHTHTQTPPPPHPPTAHTTPTGLVLVSSTRPQTKPPALSSGHGTSTGWSLVRYASSLAPAISFSFRRCSRSPSSRFCPGIRETHAHQQDCETIAPVQQDYGEKSTSSCMWSQNFMCRRKNGDFQKKWRFSAPAVNMRMKHEGCGKSSYNTLFRHLPSG